MFGFFKGKITLALDKYQFSPGGEISGKLTLSLKKSVQARGLYVQLLGKEHISENSAGGRSVRIETVFDFSLPLDGEKEYSPGGKMDYDFKLKIPEDVLSGSKGPNIGANIGFGEGGGLRIGGFVGTRRIDWYVIGRLDSPGFDITKKVKVNIA